MKLLTLLVFTSFTVWAYDTKNLPKKGFIPDSVTAVKIAEAILVPIYGKEVLKQRPFKSNLQGDIWKIEGTFHQIKGHLRLGGVASLEIKKSTGQILKVIHGK